MSAADRRREWWRRQSPERRGELRKAHRARNPALDRHHYNRELACPECGTDSSVGCIKELA